MAKKSASYRVASNCLGGGGPHTNQMQTLLEIIISYISSASSSYWERIRMSYQWRRVFELNRLGAVSKS